MSRWKVGVWATVEETVEMKARVKNFLKIVMKLM
tara:strand:- start:1782 stop:1883 length:102 start_codon:yes stop_codon:yes gene_type:complete